MVRFGVKRDAGRRQHEIGEHVSLKAIVDKLGGDLYQGGCRANIPAPGHSVRDRSISLVLTNGRVVVHAFNGADWRQVLDDLRRQGLIDTRNAPRSITSASAAVAVVHTPAPERLAVARRIWDGGRSVKGTLSERYTRLRSIERELPGTDILRHHLEAPISAYRVAGRGKAAIMAAICDCNGEFSAVEITYLDPNGRRAIGLRLSRKTVGLVPPSCAIRIDPAGAEMLVGEGFITTLSATECFQLPGWALMSTRNMRSWSAPEGVRSVLIAADRGKDGEASAEVLASRLRRQGVRPSIWLPPAPHRDWNEAARA